MDKKINNDDLEKDILEYMKIFSKEYAKYGRDKITDSARLYIDMFYNDYTPHYYNRTYDLKNNSYIPYYKNNGNSYYGGVRITSEFMSPYYTGLITSRKATDPFIVAQLAWHGWHGDPTGYNGHFIPIRTTPPLEKLTEFVNDKSFLNNAYRYANEKASKVKYKYLKI